MFTTGGRNSKSEDSKDSKCQIFRILKGHRKFTIISLVSRGQASNFFIICVKFSHILKDRIKLSIEGLWIISLVSQFQFLGKAARFAALYPKESYFPFHITEITLFVYFRNITFQITPNYQRTDDKKLLCIPTKTILHICV